jgi:hypothetical protein
MLGNLCDEETCNQGRHLWNKTRTPGIESAVVGEDIIGSYQLPFRLANLFANKGDP